MPAPFYFSLFTFHYSLFTIPYNGPRPMQLVVVMAVRNAVSAATTTFTAISMIRFFMRYLLPSVNSAHRCCLRHRAALRYRSASRRHRSASHRQA